MVADFPVGTPPPRPDPALPSLGLLDAVCVHAVGSFPPVLTSELRVFFLELYTFKSSSVKAAPVP